MTTGSTDLRRVAQLIQDLKTTEVIRKDGNMNFAMFSDGGFRLIIYGELFLFSGEYMSVTQTIKKAIEDEFPDKEKDITVLKGEIICIAKAKGEP